MMKFVFLVLIVLTQSCSTTPTGRKQLKLVGSGQMSQLGDQSFQQLKGKQSISRDSRKNELVRCVSHALLRAMGENPQSWEIVVFNDASANAFALPGKNIGVHTGMIDLVQTSDQLAAVVGHEIGHVLADHGNERMSQGMLAQTGLGVANLVMGQETQKDQLIMGALGLGLQVGVLLPFGRKQETEADDLGVRYMARAGFNPNASVELWQLMASRGGGSPPEFLSTHPSNQSRISYLSEIAPQYMGDYQASPKPNCRK